MNVSAPLSVWLFFRSLFGTMTVVVLMSACNPVPDAKLTDLSTFDDKDKRDGLIHGNSAVHPPNDADNAKIIINGNDITLTKAHVMPIKSERYQPAFRLEGVIIAHEQITITLPKEGRLDKMFIKVGDTVDADDVVGKFYEETITHASPTDDNPKADSSDDVDLSTDNIDTTNAKQKIQTPKNTKHPSKINSQEQTDDTDDEVQTPPAPIITKSLFDIKSPMTGKIEAIFTTDKDIIYPKDTPVLVVFDERFVKFISPLPAEFASHLAVGDGVTFDTEDGRSFGGQIKNIIPNAKVHDMMDIHVAITPEQAKKAKLSLGERVGGYVNYGQIEVGVLVPSFAIFNDALDPMDLSELTKPPYKPATPQPAWLWTVGQDERLALSKIFIIQYQPESDQYLISGIGLDGLIVLADLPKQAHGGRVHLK